MHTLGQSGLIGPIDRVLGQHHRGQRHVGDHGGGFERFGLQLGEREDAAHQAGALRLGGVHHAAGQAHFHGLRLADETGQSLGSAGTGDNPQLDFRLPELGVVGGQDEIAHHRHFAAPAEGETSHRGDNRFTGFSDLFPRPGDEILAIDVGIGLWLHFLDIGAGGERFLTAGQHHAANRRVGLEGRQGGAQLGHQRAGQSVQRLWPVEAN